MMKTNVVVESKSLHRALLKSAKSREKLIGDCASAVESEVLAKSGFSGLAIKGAYKIAARAKPNIVELAVEFLFDDFVDALEPFYQSYLELDARERPNLAAFILQHRQMVTETLLTVADLKAHTIDSSSLQNIYYSLRPTAQKHVGVAMPKIAALLEQAVGPIEMFFDSHDSARAL